MVIILVGLDVFNCSHKTPVKSISPNSCNHHKHNNLTHMQKSSLYLTQKPLLKGLLCFLLIVVTVKFGFQFPINAWFKWIGFFIFIIAILQLLHNSSIKYKKLYIWAILTIFIAHTSVLGGFYVAYGDTLDEMILFHALSNTNASESSEFISQNAIILFQVVSLSALLFWLTQRCLTIKSISKQTRNTLWAVMVITTLLHLNNTYRQQNPLFYWAKKVTNYQKQQQLLLQTSETLSKVKKTLPEWNASFDGRDNQIVILVFGESLNKSNMQIYGYKRETTPKLEALSHEDNMCVFTDVLSGAASTQPAIERILSTKTITNPNIREADVMMLAKSVGYKTYWITNQKDYYLYANFVSQADYVKQTNLSATGRSNSSLDENLLDPIEFAIHEQIKQPKFIVIHMIGQHPHYQLRYPEIFETFLGNDEVDAELERNGIFFWNRTQRKYYDNSIRYTDHLIGSMIEQLKNIPQPARLLFVSDHGQEVAHTKNYTGHAPNLVSGYQVPLLTWHNNKDHFNCARSNLNKPYQTDILDWGLLTFLNINTPQKSPSNDIFNPKFQPRQRWLGNQKKPIE